MPLWALKYWRVAAGAALLAVVAVGLLYVRHTGYVAGKAHTQALWDENKADIQSVADKALADARSKEAAAAATNAEVLRDANQKLVDIAADRDGLRGRLFAARQATAGRCSLPEAGSVAGTSGASPDSGNGSLDAVIADAITESLGNNVRHTALIEQIRPQLLGN